MLAVRVLLVMQKPVDSMVGALPVRVTRTRVRVEVLQTCELQPHLPTAWWLLAVVGEPVVGLAGRGEQAAGLLLRREPGGQRTERPEVADRKLREALWVWEFRVETELLAFSAAGVVGERVRLLVVEAVAEVSSVAVAEVPIAFREEVMAPAAVGDQVTPLWP
jgi:hypothetical protein